MLITPKRRRRALRIHYLTQRGRSQRQIAEQFGISRATVRSDLQLIEAHWSRIAAAIADDLLLESLHLLNIRLSLAIKQDEVANNAKLLTPVEFLHARDAQEARLTALSREIRRTAHDVHRRAAQRPDQPALYDDEDQDTRETAPISTKTDHPDPTISSPDQEIPASDAAEEKILDEPVQLPQSPELDALISEAVDHFPHLKDQSPEQILLFLDQLAEPDGQESRNAAQIYAEAAG